MMYVLGPNGEEICTPCYFNGRKPEGIAVELADAVIRVLDFAEYMNVPFDMYAAAQREFEDCRVSDDFGHEIAFFHSLVVNLHDFLSDRDIEGVIGTVLSFVACIELYLQKQGLDLWQVVELKHNYNKGRPYKHGKAF